MIKPLNSFSTMSFKGGLEDYQSQIKNKQEPKYNLVLTEGTDFHPQKPSVTKGLAGIFKGYNNVTSFASGVSNGLLKGVTFGSLAGVVAKNWKNNTVKVITNESKAVPRLSVKNFVKGTIGDVFGFVKNTFKAIPKVFSQSPIETLNSIKNLPGKYFKYLGESKAVKGIAIGVGVGTLAYNLLKAKVEANRKNANVDHSLGLKH